MEERPCRSREVDKCGRSVSFNGGTFNILWKVRYMSSEKTNRGLGSESLSCPDSLDQKIYVWWKNRGYERL